MNAPGFNPINWNCTVSGCFNYHRHFEIEHFAQCFPRKIGMTDLDGFVEVNGHFLIVEFKQAGDQFRKGADLTTGQRLAFERLTLLSDKLTVIVARCNYVTSDISEFYSIHGGHAGAWHKTTFEAFADKLSVWAREADKAEAA